MGAGIPAIGYKSCDAVNELIQDGKNGILVEDGAAALAEGLRSLMLSPKLRLEYGKVAQNQSQLYEAKTVWEKWQRLFNETALN